MFNFKKLYYKIIVLIILHFVKAERWNGKRRVYIGKGIIKRELIGF
jgi:hypothetical protein